MTWNSGVSRPNGPSGEEASRSRTSTRALLAQDSTPLRHSINLTLKDLLPPKSTAPVNLHHAMHYALLAPGKRLRPMLTLLTVCEPQRTQLETLQLACVSELVHAASLILDDLPCMDDAKQRRNQPCTHLLYSESTAILASVNLLNLAYGVIARCRTLAPETKVLISAHLSEVVGSMGLVGGQVEDLRNDAQQASAVQQLYHRKTGCLFEFAVVTGARLRGMEDAKIGALKFFSRAFGLLFQIYDDVLDYKTFGGTTGKDTGKDAAKNTLLTALTPEQAGNVIADAKRSLQVQLVRAGFDDSPLAEFVTHQVSRFDKAVQELGVLQLARTQLSTTQLSTTQFPTTQLPSTQLPST